MRSGEHAELDLTVTYEYCYGRVLELYTHPGITDDQLDMFTSAARTAYHQAATGESGRSWKGTDVLKKVK